MCSFGVSLKVLNNTTQHVCYRKLIRDDIGTPTQLLDRSRRDRADAGNRASIDNFAQATGPEKPDKIPHGAGTRERNHIDIALREQSR